MAIDDSLADPAQLVLASLADGPKHGYAITQDIEAQVQVTLRPGTLYGAISRLQDRGWIEPLPTTDRRRPYRITAAGAAELTARSQRMRAAANLGLRRLRAAGGLS